MIADERRDDGLEVAHAAQLGARIANVTTPVSTPAGSSGMPKSRWKPSAAPTNSARSVAIATASACSQRKMRVGFEKRVAADLGEVVAGGDAELRAHRLDQHRHQVRGQDDPEQQVAVLGARGDVGGEVARVDVGDRGDEGRAEERPQPAQTPAALGQRALCRLSTFCSPGSATAGRSCARAAAVGSRATRRCGCARRARARSHGARRPPRPSAGPSKGALASMTTRSSGTKPSSAR